MQDLRPPSSTEQPILRIGIAGFNPDEYRLIERSLERAEGLVRWRISPVAEADALVVNGTKVRMTANGILRVSPGLPTEQSVKLSSADVERPVAFSTPIASEDIEPRLTFSLQSAATIAAMLLQFENCLLQLRASFALGRDMVHLGTRLRHGVFHVSQRGTLLAVLDLRKGRAGISPRAHPANFEDALWESRPASAGDVPAGFIESSPAELSWNYARRSASELLPPRYREQRIYLRGAPKVPPGWVTDSHLTLLRELAIEPCTYEELQQRTALSDGEMQQVLTCLYFACAITTTRSKAARATARTDAIGPDSSGTGLESVSPVNVRPRFVPDITAPGSLNYRRGPAVATGDLQP